MNEVRELIAFMRSGKRKEIFMEEYLFIQRRNRKWTRKRECLLLKEIEKSSVISIGYKRVEGRLKKTLIRND